jgi:nucleotide-binding universal stress UspA family protein
VIDPASQPLHHRAEPGILGKIAASFAGMAMFNLPSSRNPPAVIVDLAAARPGTLIAMATRLRAPKRWLMGSVAERVLDATTNHLLLVRPGEGDRSSEAHLKRMLVPLDGSEVAERVLPTVAELASRLNLEVVLVRVVKHVYTTPPEAILPVFGANIPNPKQLWEEARLEAENYLTDRVEDLRAHGVANVASMALVGGADGAAAEIIDLAEHTPENLVAMSTHGESGLGRWLIGSVTQRVVRHSTGPVLVIR